MWFWWCKCFIVQVDIACDSILYRYPQCPKKHSNTQIILASTCSCRLIPRYSSRFYAQRSLPKVFECNDLYDIAGMLCSIIQLLLQKLFHRILNRLINTINNLNFQCQLPAKIWVIGPKHSFLAPRNTIQYLFAKLSGTSGTMYPWAYF